MLIKILLVIAIVIQCVATGYALRLVRTTKYNSVWILFIVGFSLLSVERLRVRGHSALVVRLPGHRDLDLPVDRRDVRPQALQIHRPA